MYMGVYGGIGVVEAIVEVLREMILLLSCTSAGKGKFRFRMFLLSFF